MVRYTNDRAGLGFHTDHYWIHSYLESVLVTDTPVSRSLGATFREITRQPTPLEYRVALTTTVAPVIGTTEMIPSSFYVV